MRIVIPGFALTKGRRTESMKVTPPSAPSAQSVQTKKNPPVDLAISP